MGWIRLHREVQDHWIYKDAEHLKVWVEMLLRARYWDEPSMELIEDQLVKIERGDFVYGRQKWSKRLGISEQRLRTLIRKMVQDDMIELVQKFNRFTIYKIKNYEKFNQQVNQQENQEPSGFEDDDNQQDNQQSTSSQPAVNQQLTTYKERSNKDKNNNSSSRKNARRIYEVDDRYYQMAVYLHEKIMKHAAINKVEHLVRDADMQKWADDFRKIVELDKRDSKELQSLIDWSTSHHFWSCNILSPKKLREKYTDLGMKMATEGKKASSGGNRQEQNKDVLRKHFQEDGYEEKGNPRTVVNDYYSLPSSADE